MDFRRCRNKRGAASTRSAAIFFVLLLALSALICGTSRDALASAGCNAVNAGGFNVSAGGFGNKTIAGFAAGDNLTFGITWSKSGIWLLRTATFTNLGGSPIFAKSGSQTKTYTVTGGNQDAALTLYRSDGTTVTASCSTVAATVVPTVTSISQASGPTTGGTSVTIVGTGFTGVTSVNFGSNATSYTFNSDTSITGTVPAGNGTVDVTVITAAGRSATSAADQFTYTDGSDEALITVLPRPDPRRRSARSRPTPTPPTPPTPPTAWQSPATTSSIQQRVPHSTAP
jgi:hypothetical protein